MDIHYGHQDPILRDFLAMIERRGMTDRAAIKMIGMSHSAIYDWRQGHKPTAESASRMAKVLRRTNLSEAPNAKVTRPTARSHR